MVLFGSRSREVAVVEDAVLATAPRVPLPGIATPQERPSVRGHPQQELLGIDPLVQHVVDGRLTRDSAARATIQLGMMARLVGPGAGEIVRHDV